MSIIDPQSRSQSVAVTTPSVPSDWLPGASSRRGVIPLGEEIDAAEAAAIELAELDEYDRLFWPKAPPRAQAVETLLAAAHASNERRRAEAWLAFQRDQEARAWARLAPVLRFFRRAWRRVVDLDETIGLQMSGLSVLLSSRSEVVKRGNRTRRRHDAEAAREAAKPAKPVEGTNQKP